MADLKEIGLIVALVGAIIAVVNIVLGLLGEAIDVLSFGNVGGGFVGGLGWVVALIAAIIVIMIYLGRLPLPGQLVVAIVVIVCGLFTNVLVILGGVLILIDELM